MPVTWTPYCNTTGRPYRATDPVLATHPGARAIAAAYRAARKDGRPRYVGPTYATWFVATSFGSCPAEDQHIRYRVNPDGSIERRAD